MMYIIVPTFYLEPIPMFSYTATLGSLHWSARFTILEEGPAGLDILASNLSKVQISGLDLSDPNEQWKKGLPGCLG